MSRNLFNDSEAWANTIATASKVTTDSFPKRHALNA